MPYNVYSPEAGAKIAAYLRMLERNALVWKEEYRKPLEELRKRKENKKPGQKI